jgi:hypothetical protein
MWLVFRLRLCMTYVDVTYVTCEKYLEQLTDVLWAITAEETNHRLTDDENWRRSRFTTSKPMSCMQSC